MLSLLWTRLRRRVLFWCKLFSFSCVGHLVILFFILFVYSGQKSVFTVNINRSILKSGASIIFMPLRRSAPKTAKQIVTQVSVAKPGSVKPVMQKTVSKSSVKKSVKKPGLVKKKPPVKKPVKKPVAKKVVKKPEKKEVKKPVKKPEKKVAQKRMPKPEQKKKAPVVKKIEPAKQKKVAKKEVPKPAAKAPAKKMTKEKEAIYIGQQELEALKVQYDIEREVTKYWRPPAGLSKELSCTIAVVADWSGAIKQVTVKKPSGVLIFDISARTAVAKVSVPKSLWGKEVDINFGQ